MRNSEIICAGLNEVLGDLGQDEGLVGRYFHQDYIQHVDGKMLDYAGFVKHLAMLRSRVESIDISVDQIIESGDQACTIHRAHVLKKDGSRSCTKVIAYYRFKDEKIVLVDEMTHLLEGAEADQDLGSCT